MKALHHLPHVHWSHL